MVQTPPRSIPLEAFLQLPETKPASEFIDGQILQKPMPQGEHSTIQGELVTVINAVTKPERIAWAFPELRCTFSGRSIVPDIAVFTWEHLPTNPDGTIANIFESHPDWIIEILSPDQSSTKVTAKILYSLNQGSQLGWLIDPAERSVLVYPPKQQPELFEQPDDALPVPTFASKLQLTIAQMFSWLKVQ